ncbi:hypothetical protein HX890_26580 [Pseudomonas gingeri]|uniref:hypothetical protein n=1 Tax=Pseudomonas gingeri TaxID=117681 RepID=UPI0015A03FA5|nr:hypothetical protein [Pseudomonas gingeri]NWD77693.1 hypothetical protein [Pseudomonas gingeri]
MALYEDLLALTFEDRIAQSAMALLYSASHVEITATMQPYEPREIRNGNPRAAAITARQDVLKGRLDSARDAASQPIKRLGTPTGELQATPEVLIRIDLQPSEIDMDTTACALVGDTVYLACNFKRRSIVGAPKLSRPAYHYLGFGNFPDVSIALLSTALREELEDVRVNGTGTDRARAQAIRFCKIIGPGTDPTTAVQNAEAHAEMQLVNHCLPKVIDNTGELYLGVSRPCCPNCTRALQAARIGFTRSHNIEAQNWRSPNAFSTKLLHTFAM